MLDAMSAQTGRVDVVVFDLDGTLVDSDHALDSAFVACGVAREEISHGHVLAEECERLGITVEAYLSAYDPSLVVPFDGVEEMLDALGRWAVFSNKRGEVGPRELAAMGWHPEVAMFADSFAGPKRMEPVLERLGIGAGDALVVGDTLHDRRAARAAGCRFVWAGWNPRVEPVPGDEVAREPGDVLTAIRGQLLG